MICYTSNAYTISIPEVIEISATVHMLFIKCTDNRRVVEIVDKVISELLSSVLLFRISNPWFTYSSNFQLLKFPRHPRDFGTSSPPACMLYRSWPIMNPKYAVKWSFWSNYFVRYYLKSFEISVYSLPVILYWIQCISNWANRERTTHHRKMHIETESKKAKLAAFPIGPDSEIFSEIAQLQLSSMEPADRFKSALSFTERIMWWAIEKRNCDLG